MEDLLGNLFVITSPLSIDARSFSVLKRQRYRLVEAKEDTVAMSKAIEMALMTPVCFAPDPANAVILNVVGDGAMLDMVVELEVKLPTSFLGAKRISLPPKS